MWKIRVWKLWVRRNEYKSHVHGWKIRKRLGVNLYVYICSIFCNIFFPSTPRSSKWVLTFGFPYYRPESTHTYRMCGQNAQLLTNLFLIMLWAQTMSEYHIGFYCLSVCSEFIVAWVAIKWSSCHRRENKNNFEL